MFFDIGFMFLHVLLTKWSFEIKNNVYIPFV